jgi:hypothetical protein
MKRILTCVPLLAVCLMPLQCSTLEKLSLGDIITKSTAIVRAKVTGSYAVYSGPVIYTHYQLQVSESLKGTNGTSVDLAVPGGVANNFRQSFTGAPQFSVGDEYVFFLWTGKSGVTQVIGLTQGLFAVARGSSTNPTVTRSASRELMLEQGTGHPVKDQTLVMSLSDLRARIANTLAAAGQSAVQ